MKTIDLIDRPDLMAKRIVKCYNAASDEAIENGENWYSRANEIASIISSKHGVSLQTVCGVIAALSPATNWVQNVVDSCNLIFAYSQGIDMDEIVVTTYGQNKQKAIFILRGHFASSDIESVLLHVSKVSKTHAFYLNILFGSAEQNVTIDRHAIRIALNRKDSDEISITEKRYRNVAIAYRIAAKKLGYLPKDLQAIVWIAYRENVPFTIPAAVHKLDNDLRAQIIG